MTMDKEEPIKEEPKKPAPIQELHKAITLRETLLLEQKLNEVIRAVNWLLSHT